MEAGLNQAAARQAESRASSDAREQSRAAGRGWPRRQPRLLQRAPGTGRGGGRDGPYSRQDGTGPGALGQERGNAGYLPAARACVREIPGAFAERSVDGGRAQVAVALASGQKSKPATVNVAIGALKFLFRTTLGRPAVMEGIRCVRTAHPAPDVLSGSGGVASDRARAVAQAAPFFASEFGQAPADSYAFWASSKGTGEFEGYRLGVDFSTGYSGAGIQDVAGAQIRCVRGMPLRMSLGPHYTNNGAEIRDNWTGLVWRSLGLKD